MRKGEDEKEKKVRKNKIKKRWIRGEGIVCVSKRESFGDLWREKRI